MKNKPFERVKMAFSEPALGVHIRHTTPCETVYKSSGQGLHDTPFGFQIRQTLEISKYREVWAVSEGHCGYFKAHCSVCTYETEHFAKLYWNSLDKVLTIHYLRSKSKKQSKKYLQFYFQNTVKNEPFQRIKMAFSKSAASCAQPTQKNLQNSMWKLRTRSLLCIIWYLKETSRCTSTLKIPWIMSSLG